MAGGQPDPNKPPATGGESETPPKWATDLQASMTQVGTGISQLVDLAKQGVEQGRAAVAASTTPVEDEDPADILDAQNLEMLPRSEFARRLQESFEATLNKALKPIETRIDQTANATLTNAYFQEAEKFAAKTADFADWGPEMEAIAKQHGGLPIARIYAIARSENPTKVAELAKKYAAAGGETPPPKPKPKTAAPLAITPGSNDSSVQNQRMSQEDAAQDAWDKAVEKYGDPFA